jgi:mannitol-1-phosphate 5-dehydrogenase
MNAVIVGPGRIGCGLAGQLLADAGASLTFIGRGAVVEYLARVGSYHVRLVQGRSIEEREVPVRDALSASDSAAAAAIAAADLVIVSVRPPNLESITPLLVAGLSERETPANVLVFENDVEAGPRLRRLVANRTPAGAPEHGFSSAVVSRIVSRRVGDPAGAAPLVFIGDPPADVVVHGPSLRGPLPEIPGLRAVDDLDAWFARKLFVFCAGHAVAAYLGALKGYRYIHSAIRDPEIRRHVFLAMDEGRLGVLAAYGPELAPTLEDMEAIVTRFENAALNDPVWRVARDPRRKLTSNDRLVGAARLAERAGVCPTTLALATAAALCYTGSGEASACEPQAALDSGAVVRTLREVSGLDPAAGLGRLVADSFRELAGGVDNRLWSFDANAPALLSLKQGLWSWRPPERASTHLTP